MPANRVSKHNRHTTWPDWFADSFIGLIVVAVFKPQIYPEQQPDFDLPERYRRQRSAPHHPSHSSSAETLVEHQDADRDRSALPTPIANDPGEILGRPAVRKRNTNEVERASSQSQTEKETKNKAKKTESKGKKEKEDDKPSSPEDDPNIVTWYGDNDPANPQNWSLLKKCVTTGQLCLLTTSIYIGSAIYSPGYMSIEQEFGINQTVASLGLTLFVFGYGIGPLFLSAASEIPAVGRNPPYIITLAIFVCLQVPSYLAPNIGSLLVLRFLAGFVGSPVLATGGASLADLFNPKTRPYAIGIWGLSAVCGPVLGPLAGGFAIAANGWRWAFLLLLWLDGFCLLTLIFTMPETSAQTILYRRAQRLRQATGNDKLQSQGEIMAKSMTPKKIANMTLVMPFWLSFTEPILFALNLYIGLIYSILYCFIESFSLVFAEMYGFNLGENGLSYLGLFVGAVLAYTGFCFYNAFVTIPKMRDNGGTLPPEARLPVACFASFFLPVGLFIFGWCSNPSIHWIVPIIGSGFFGIGVYLMFQAVLNFIGDSYADNAPSAYAGNDFVRSMMGGAFPLFSTPMFRNLGHGVAWGSTLLALLTVIFIPIPFVLHRYGSTLRNRSKYAMHD